MLIIPPKGVHGRAINIKIIKSIYYGNSTLQFVIEGNSYHWQQYPSDTNMEEEFRRVCNEVNSLLAKPTIQL